MTAAQASGKLPASTNLLDVSESPAASESVTLARTGAVLLGLQGALLLLVAAFYGYRIWADSAASPSGAVGTAALSVLAGLTVLAVARGVARRSRWSIAPAVLTEILMLAVAVPLVPSASWYAGMPLLLTAVAVLAVVLRLSSRNGWA